LRAAVPEISAERFAAIAADAKANCPVSRVLKAQISLDAQLEGDR
jgi:osmotically inducible protein OsmC